MIQISNDIITVITVIYNLLRLRLSRLYMATRGEYFQYTHFKMWILSQYEFGVSPDSTNI